MEFTVLEALIFGGLDTFLGSIFDGDHDFVGPRAPKAHLDTVNTKLSHQLGRPFTHADRLRERRYLERDETFTCGGRRPQNGCRGRD